MLVYFHNQDLPIVWLIVVSIAIAVVLVIASYFLAVHSTDIDKSVLINGFYPHSNAREKLEILIFLVAIYHVLFLLLYEYEFFLFISLSLIAFTFSHCYYYY